MVIPVGVSGPGPAQMQRIAKSLKEAGNKDLRNELRRQVRSAAKPLVDDIKRSADLTLPSGGGLNKVVSRRSGISAKTSVSNAGIAVRISGSAKKQLKQINAGTVRHPTYGRKPWQEQRVTPGFWDKPVKRSGPRIRKAVMQAVTDISKKVT